MRQLATLALTALLGLTAAHADEPLRLATGVPEGNYARIGEQLAGVLREGGVEVELVGTSGSLANLNLIQAGEADFALCQFEILTSMSEILYTPRMVLYVYPEPIHVLVRKDAEIDGFADLAGKRVDIGPEGSGTTSIALRLTRAQGIELSEVATVSQSNPAEALQRLQAGELDAMLFTTAYPSPLLTQLDAEAGESLELLTWTQEATKAMEGGGVISFWARDRHYPWRDGTDWRSPGAICMLVASSKVPAARVQRVAELIYGHWGQLSRANDAWRFATKLNFGQDDLFKPSLERFFHSGAVAFHEARQQREVEVGQALNAIASGDLAGARDTLTALAGERWDALHPNKQHSASTFLMFSLLGLNEQDEALAQGARLHTRNPDALVSFAELSNDGATGAVAELRDALRAVTVIAGRGASVVYLHNASQRAVRLHAEQAGFEVSYGYKSANASVESLSADGTGAFGAGPAWIELAPGGGAFLRSADVGSGALAAMLPEPVSVLATQVAGSHFHLVRDSYSQVLEELVVRCDVEWGEDVHEGVTLIDYRRAR